MKRNKEATETFAKNLKAALPLAGLDYTLDDVNWLEQTDDWAAGSRYNAQINGKIYIQIATINDEIYSIKNTKNGATDDSVSYTHLDVYKRQLLPIVKMLLNKKGD